jgi:hypothetical protein
MRALAAEVLFSCTGLTQDAKKNPGAKALIALLLRHD